MSLHARSVALSIGTPAELVDQVAGELVQRGEVKVAAAERILKQFRRAEREDSTEQLPVEAAAPGKVVLFGEHAVVYGHAGITASIDIGLKVRLSHDPDGPRFLQPRLTLECPGADCDIDMRRFSRAVDAALEQYGLSHEPLAIEVESDLVPGMGLGSSAAFSTALCRALRRYARGGEDEDTGEGLFAEVQELERIFHGQPSGIDAATVISGGVLWFRKGPPREVLPIRLPRPVAGMVCIVEPGARTIELVRQVAHSRELDQARTDAILEEIGALTAEAGSALGSGDYVRAGMLMLRNHEALERLGVSTPRLDEAVELLLNNGALGAKLTGAGGGGAVVALVEPEQLAGLVRSVQGSFLLAYPFELGSY
jgi:hydroxymethylglutaryl-CoA reductase